MLPSLFYFCPQPLPKPDHTDQGRCTLRTTCNLEHK